MNTPILTYHSIGEHIPRGFAPWVVHPDRFERQLGLLSEAGLRTLTVTDLARWRRAGKPPQQSVVLTFDDGFEDFSRNALPRLYARGMTATLYVTSGVVGGCFRDLPVLDWGGLAEIRDAGFEIGAHTISHPALDRLNPVQIQNEILGSKRQIEDRLGIAVESFAYPFGYCTKQARQAVIAAGYSSACAIGYQLSPDNDDPFALRRMIVRPHGKRVHRLWASAPFYRLRSVGWAVLRRTIRSSGL